MVDISCSEGRPAVEDFETISAELEKFSPELAARPRIVVANKSDLLVDSEDEFIEIPELSEEAAALELRCAELGYELYYISAARKLGLKDLVDAIEALTHEKTIIMIAHRLKTVRNADQILVVDQGKIVQQGKHNELMQQEGIYRRFVNAREQAAGWKL